MPDALAVWGAVTALGLAAQPLAAWALSPLRGAGAGLARPLGVLLPGVALWLAASVPVAAYGTGSAWAAAGIFAAAGLFGWRSHRPSRADLRVLLAAELTFTLAYILALVVVSHAPDVWGTEKPMDMAFLSAIQAAGHLPPNDPWLSGEPLNYYYLGHYLMAFVTRIAGTGPTESYNLSVALVWALGAAAAFGLGAAATARLRGGRAWLLGGSACALLVVLGGNALAVWKLLTHEGPLTSYDWFGASRAVPGGINDFPAFEAILGDVHAHVISVPFTLLALALALRGLEGPARVALAAVVLGALYAMNSWAFPVLATMFAAMTPRPRPIAALLIGAIGIYLPFHLGFDPAGARGIRWVPERQAIGPFLADLGGAYGFALVVVLVAAAVQLRGRSLRWTGLAALAMAPLALTGDLAGPALLVVALVAVSGIHDRFLAGLSVLGVACLLGPELFYVRDAFEGGEHFRMNTLHKVGFEAWILLGVAAAIVVGCSGSRALASPLALLAAAALAFPLAAGWARTQGLRGPAHLDGLRWLAEVHPGDPAAIAYLRRTAPRDAVVLEAVGPEYSPRGHARISVFTGRSTVLGWEGHELFWGHADDLGTRAADVAEAYSTTDVGRARGLLARYRVDYVVVGPLERETYPGPGAGKFGRIGTRVFSARGTEVFRVEQPEDDSG